MIAQNGNKTSLKTLIINEASSPEYRYDEKKHVICGRGASIDGTVEEFKRLSKHHEICKKLYELSQQYNNFPFTPLVYIAIGSGAHKQSAFKEGYTTFNEKKTRKILGWLSKLAKHCGDDKFMSNDRIVHAMVKFYDKVSKETNVFTTLLKQFNIKGKKASSWNTMEEFYTEFTRPMFNNIQIV